MISIPINKSFSANFSRLIKVSPGQGRRGQKQGRKDRERRENGRNLSAYSGVSFLAEEGSYFWNGDKSDLKGRFRANSDKLISQERNDEKRGFWRSRFSIESTRLENLFSWLWNRYPAIHIRSRRNKKNLSITSLSTSRLIFQLMIDNYIGILVFITIVFHLITRYSCTYNITTTTSAILYRWYYIEIYMLKLISRSNIYVININMPIFNYDCFVQR